MKLKARIKHWLNNNDAPNKKATSYWKRFMDSTQEKLSHGAASLMKLIPYARKDNWRRKDK